MSGEGGGVQIIKYLVRSCINVFPTLDTGSGTVRQEQNNSYANMHAVSYHQTSLAQDQTVVMVGPCMQTL